MNEKIAISISEDLSFVHDPFVAQGKTRNMAKGLFLRYRGKMCAGESAGMGLPILKNDRETIFPSLISVNMHGQSVLKKRFAFDHTLTWHALGRTIPSVFGRIVESGVEKYKKLPHLQHILLGLRDIIFRLFLVHSVMNKGAVRGYCTIVYEKTFDGLVISANGSFDQKSFRVFILNEVDGRSFNRLRIGEPSLQDNQISAWQVARFGYRLESSLLGIGYSIALVPKPETEDISVFCGRELALDLDWAGFSIETKILPITYEIHVHE